MESTFLEKIIVKDKQPIDYLKIAGIIFAFFILFFVAIMFLSVIAPLVIIGAGWGAWWLITGMSKEYEYIITDNYLDIDCIVAQRKRHRVFSGDAKQFEICAKANTELYKQYAKGNQKILDFAPTQNSDKNYFIVTKNNAKKAKTKGQNVLVLFEPDEEMVPALKKYNPSKIKIDGVF